jgi:Tol biopolymer transport system component
MPQGVFANAPRFSPDGQRLSFSYGPLGEDDSLAVVGLDGKNLQVLTAGCSTWCESAWHPTSGELFFTGEDGVRAVSATGGAARLVHDPFGSVSSVDVSPDGKTLLLDGFDIVLFTLADGSTREIPTQENVYGLRYSPDGKKAVYQDFSTEAVRILDLETGTATTLIDTDNYLTSADWFPDGNRLAVLTDESLEILTLQQGAEPTRQVLRDGFALKDVDVSPDGKSIAYCINGQPSIFVLTGF